MDEEEKVEEGVEEGILDPIEEIDDFRFEDDEYDDPDKDH